jgi:phospholipid/cholesterol/gamma-HCH transport system ATP-binding protein
MFRTAYGRNSENSAEAVSASDPVLDVLELAVKYGEKTVLSNIGFAVYPKEIRVILGTSGCGKTTLLKAIIGLLPPCSGTVKMFGKKLADPDSYEGSEQLRRIGVLFQNGALMGSLTVADNIRLPLEMHTGLSRGIIDEMVRIKLGQVELSHAADRLPGELSGGMRKRAALARALAMDPPLLFCDEPSAGLDPVTSAGLDELLLKLRNDLGITIVVVTHELLSIQKIADNILFLDDGRVLFNGRLEEALMEKSGPVSDFFARRRVNNVERN